MLEERNLISEAKSS